MKIASAMTEASMLTELGERAKQYRVGLNLTQAELAGYAGVSQRTVERLEAGSSVQLESLLRVLRALRLSGNLDQLIPEASVRPIQLAGSRKDVRHRAYKKRTSTGSGWSWGDKR